MCHERRAQAGLCQDVLFRSCVPVRLGRPVGFRYRMVDMNTQDIVKSLPWLGKLLFSVAVDLITDEGHDGKKDWDEDDCRLEPPAPGLQATHDPLGLRNLLPCCLELSGRDLPTSILRVNETRPGRSHAWSWTRGRRGLGRKCIRNDFTRTDEVSIRRVLSPRYTAFSRQVLCFSRGAQSPKVEKGATMQRPSRA